MKRRNSILLYGSGRRKQEIEANEWLNNKIQKSHATQIIYSTFITATFHLYYLYTKTTSIQRSDAVTGVQIPDQGNFLR